MTKLRVEIEIACDGRFCGDCAHLVPASGLNTIPVCRCSQINTDDDTLVGDMALVLTPDGKVERHPLCLAAETDDP